MKMFRERLLKSVFVGDRTFRTTYLGVSFECKLPKELPSDCVVDDIEFSVEEVEDIAFHNYIMERFVVLEGIFPDQPEAHMKKRGAYQMFGVFLLHTASSMIYNMPNHRSVKLHLYYFFLLMMYPNFGQVMSPTLLDKMLEVIDEIVHRVKLLDCEIRAIEYYKSCLKSRTLPTPELLETIYPIEIQEETICSIETEIDTMMLLSAFCGVPIAYESHTRMFQARTYDTLKYLKAVSIDEQRGSAIRFRWSEK